MIWIFVAVASLLVLFTAWFAVNLVTAKLNNTPSRAFFDIEEATDYVAENVPTAVASNVSHDEVRLLLRWYLTYFRERGMATFGGVDRAAESAIRRNRPSIADEDDVVDELFERAQEEGLDLTTVDIVCVTDLAFDYMVAIGAVAETVDISGALRAGSVGELGEADAEADDTPG